MFKKLFKYIYDFLQEFKYEFQMSRCDFSPFVVHAFYVSILETFVTLLLTVFFSKLKN